MFTRFAKETWLVVDKLNASDHVVANNASYSVKGDVAETPMECDDVDDFWHGCCSVNSLSFVQAICADRNIANRLALAIRNLA